MHQASLKLKKIEVDQIKKWTEQNLNAVESDQAPAGFGAVKKGTIVHAYGVERGSATRETKKWASGVHPWLDVCLGVLKVVKKVVHDS